MKPLRKLNRRSFLASVAGTFAAGTGVALAAGAAGAQNSQGRGVNDTDCGANADMPGGGGKYTDRDTGPNADPRCAGRGPPRTGCTDTDAGRHADRANHGRRCRPQP